MAYLLHMRQTASGVLPGGERWSTGVSLDLPGIITVPQETLQDFTDAAVPKWATWVNSPGMKLPSSVYLTELETRVVGTDGKTVGLAQQGMDDGGTGVATTMPNQCAIVASLITTGFGARARGRMYLPALGLSGLTNGVIPTATITGLLATVKTLLVGINDAANGAFTANSVRCCVASGVGSGANYEVTAVRVGNVVDTQRRRRDKLQESYSRVELFG